MELSRTDTMCFFFKTVLKLFPEKKKKTLKLSCCYATTVDPRWLELHNKILKTIIRQKWITSVSLKKTASKSRRVNARFFFLNKISIIYNTEVRSAFSSKRNPLHGALTRDVWNENTKQCDNGAFLLHGKVHIITFYTSADLRAFYLNNNLMTKTRRHYGKYLKRFSLKNTNGAVAGVRQCGNRTVWTCITNLLQWHNLSIIT